MNYTSLGKKMRLEKDFLIHMVNKQKDCEFSLKFLIKKETGLLKNFFTMLKLVKKNTRTEMQYNYGEYVLGEILLDIDVGKETISTMYPNDDQKGKFTIPDFGDFTIQNVGDSEFVRSSYRYGIIKDSFPVRYCSFDVSQNEKIQKWHQELVNEKNPYFPTLNEAVISFFGLPVEDFNFSGKVYVVIPDYRARIEKLTLVFSKAELSVTNPEIKHNDLLLKIFAKSGTKTTVNDVYPKSEPVTIDVGFRPDALYAVLLSREDSVKIDAKEFTKWSNEEGVFVERPAEEILYLTKVGESQNLEYKPDIQNDTKRNDFIESVIAFLNTNKGIILIGVDDDGGIVGSRKTVEAILKMIHDCCEPPPKGVKVNEAHIGEDTLIVVEVPEGDNKPYQSKIDKNFYVRHNASDMRMERSELYNIVEKHFRKNVNEMPYDY